MNFDLKKNLAWLLDQEPFFAKLSLCLDKIPNKDIATCGVKLNEKRMNYELHYNPDFLNSLESTKHILGVLKHEFYHLVFNHVGKRTRENPKFWNIAADLAINGYLVDELPDIAVMPGKGIFAPFPMFQTADWYYDAILNMSEEDRKQIEESMDTIDSHDWESANKEGNSPAETYSKQIADEKINQGIKDSAAESKKTNQWGSVSVDVRKEIVKNFLSSKTDWKKVLRYFCITSKRMDRVNTVKRLNRRYPYIHPGKKINKVAKIALSFDQSGSVDDSMISKFFAEIEKLSKIVEFHVIPFDCTVDEQNVFLFKKGQRVNLQRTRYGGTNFDAPTQYVNDRNFDAHIVFTDLYAPFPKKSSCKRMWVTTKDLYTNRGYDREFDKEKIIAI